MKSKQSAVQIWKSLDQIWGINMLVYGKWECNEIREGLDGAEYKKLLQREVEAAAIDS